MNAGIYPPSSQVGALPCAIGGSPPRPVQMPASFNLPLDWRRVGRQQWDRFSDAIYETVRVNQWRFTPWTSSATFASGSNPYISGVLMADGRIFFCPFGATAGQVYDPVADRVTTPAGSYGGSSAYSSGVLLQNGDVCLIPRNQACRVYSPTTNSVRTIGSAPSVANSYNSGVLLPDGRVYCVPFGATAAQVIDTQSSTITAVPGTVYSSNGGLLLPDGRVMIVPSGNPFPIYFYDPIANTHTASATTLPASVNWVGGVLLPSGDVLLAPSSGTAALIYDYRRDRLFTPAGTTSTLNAGTLLPDGGALLLQTTVGSAHRVYYQATDTMISLPVTVSAGSEFNNAAVLPDGRMFLYPRNTTTGRGYGVKGGPKFPADIALSAYYNKR